MQTLDLPLELYDLVSDPRHGGLMLIALGVKAARFCGIERRGFGYCLSL